MFLTPTILAFTQLERTESVNADMSKDLGGWHERKVKAVASGVHIVHISHLFFFLFWCWRGNVMASAVGMVRGADRCVRPGAIHHAPLTGIFKDKKPSAAAIHQL